MEVATAIQTKNIDVARLEMTNTLCEKLTHIDGKPIFNLAHDEGIIVRVKLIRKIIVELTRTPD